MGADLVWLRGPLHTQGVARPTGDVSDEGFTNTLTPTPTPEGRLLSLVVDFTPHTHARRASSHLTPSTLWV